MFGNLTGWHLLIIVAVVLLLFGAPKLPGFARSLGQSMRIFRSEVKTMKSESEADAATPAADAATAGTTGAQAPSPAASTIDDSATPPKP
jgi:sec-independent protein translocase protein TatA